MRVGWFASMPAETEPLEARDFSTDVVPLLLGDHHVEVYAASEGQAQAWRNWVVPVRSPFEFVWRHLRDPFDLVVYHLNNEPSHEYVWGYVFNYPGLLVLQDVHVHHSRARVLLDRLDPRLQEYGDELHVNHAVDPAVRRQLALFSGPTLRVWPMRRAAMAASRSVAVHAEVLAEELKDEYPDITMQVIRPGVADPGTHDELRVSKPASELRARLGIGAEDAVVGVVGASGRPARVVELLQALASLRTTRSNLRLIIAATRPSDCDISVEARRMGVADRVAVVEPVSPASLGGFLGACDIAACLAWPPGANTIPNWLRPLACGLPTLVTRRREHAHLPLLDPVTWTLGHVTDRASDDPIGVSIDLDSERRSLHLALSRLAVDPTLRRQIGLSGRAWWSRRHTLRHMADDYLAAIDRAFHRKPPAAALPRHLRVDVFAHARRLAATAGGSLPSELTSRPEQGRTE